MPKEKDILDTKSADKLTKRRDFLKKEEEAAKRTQKSLDAGVEKAKRGQPYPDGAPSKGPAIPKFKPEPTRSK